jgi:hypothetical protein
MKSLSLGADMKSRALIVALAVIAVLVGASAYVLVAKLSADRGSASRDQPDVGIGPASGAPANSAVATVTAAAGTATATRPAASTSKIVFAGETTNEPGTSIALVVSNGTAIAYLCSGYTEMWLKGTVTAGKVKLAQPKGGPGALTATIAGTAATGVATSGPTARWRFTIHVVTKPYGLYRAVTADLRGAKLVGGWIVLPNGKQVGATTVDGATAPAPPLDLNTASTDVNGTKVQAHEVDGVTL